MKWLFAGLVLASAAFAQIRITVDVPPPPTITVRADFRFSLVPGIVVVERVPEPGGVLVVYRSSRVAEVYSYHHRDLSARGWVRVRYQVRGGSYKAEYRRGRAKARLEVRDRRGQVEVKVKED